MIFKEEDCVNMICPFHEDSLCEGFGCPAWRWFREKKKGESYGEREGYCGLAGKPEFK